jgi:hypothetical protein
MNNVFSGPLLHRLAGDFVRTPGMLAAFDYNWVGGTITHGVPAWFGAHNVRAEGRRVWPAGSMPDFVLPVRSDARDAGVDLSKPVTIAGRSPGALPGMTPGYYRGEAPDMGVWPSDRPEAVGPRRRAGQAGRREK